MYPGRFSLRNLSNTKLQYIHRRKRHQQNSWDMMSARHRRCEY